MMYNGYCVLRQTYKMPPTQKDCCNAGLCGKKKVCLTAHTIS